MTSSRQRIKGMINMTAIKSAKRAHHSWSDIAKRTLQQLGETPRGSNKKGSATRLAPPSKTQAEVAVQDPLQLSSPRDLIAAGGFRSPRAKNQKHVKVRFAGERLVVSGDGKCFIYVIKFKKKHYARRNERDEVIRTYYRGAWRSFEDDFEYYDYEVCIGQLDIAESVHMMHVNEQRDPLRRTQ